MQLQPGYMLYGLCYCDSKLCVVDGCGDTRHTLRLAVYKVEDDDHTARTPLSEIEIGTIDLEQSDFPLGVYAFPPRIERYSQRLFVPFPGSGVTVAHLRGEDLVKEKTLSCVKGAVSVDPMSPDIAYVCDWDKACVHAVDVTQDKILHTLESLPGELMDRRPYRIAVLGESILVGYDQAALAVYHHGSLAPVRVIPQLDKLQWVSTISTESGGHFLITDDEENCVFVLDVKGELRHRVNVCTKDSAIRDCVVVNRQLWVGCEHSNIIIMSQ